MSITRICGWVVRYPVRFLFYSFLASTAIGLLSFALLLCRQGGAFESWLANRLQIRAWTERLGVEFSSIDVQCLRADCPLGVVVKDISFRQQIPEKIAVDVKRVHLGLFEGLSIHKIRINTGQETDPITIERVEASLSARKITIHNTEVLLGANPGDFSLKMKELSVSELSFPPDSGETLAVRKLEVIEVDLFLQPGEDGKWSFAGAQPLLSIPKPLAEEAESLMDFFRRGIARVRTGVRWALIIGTALFLFVKLLLLRPLPAPASLRVLATLSVLFPFGYYLFFRHLSILWLLLASFLASLTVAVLLHRILYRRGREFHQRWEPFFLDLASPVVLLPLLIVHGFTLSLPAGLPSTVNIAKFEVHKTHGVLLLDSNTPQATHVRLDIPAITANNISVGLGPALTELPTLDVDKVFLRGELETNFLSQPLEKVQYIPLEWKRDHRLALCLSATVTSSESSLGSPPECPLVSGALPELAIGVSAWWVPAEDKFQFITKTRLQTPLLDVWLEADGNSRSIHIQRIETLGPKESTVQIAEGSGSLSWEGEPWSIIRLRRLALPLATSRISADWAEISASSSREPEKLKLTADLGGVTLATEEGYVANIDKARIRFSQTVRNKRRQIVFHTLLQRTEITGKRPTELAAEFPSVKVTVIGHASPERIPQRFKGEASLLISRSRNSLRNPAEFALRMGNPLKFEVDVWQGKLTVPDQPLQIHQSILPQAPGSILLNLKAYAAWGVNGPSLHASYKTDWNQVTLPRLPQLAVNEITKLDLKTKGTVTNLPWDEVLQSGFLSWLVQTRAGPPAPSRKIRFRLEGTLVPEVDTPLLKIFFKPNRGIQVDKAKIHRLCVHGARLEALQFSSTLSQIVPLDGEQTLEIASNVTISGDTLDLTASIPHPDGVGSFCGNLRRRRGQLRFKLLQKLSLGTFFDHLGLTFDGIDLRDTQITKLDITAESSGGQLTVLEAALELAAGKLLSLNLPKVFRQDDFPLIETVRFSLDPSHPENKDALRLKITLSANALPALVAKIKGDVRGMSLEIVTNEGQTVHINFDLGGKAKIALHTADGPVVGSIRARLTTAFGNLLGHFRKAVHVFGDQTDPSTRKAADLAWKLNLRNRQPGGTPVLAVAEEKWRLGFQADVEELSWKPKGEVQSFRVSSSVEVGADLTVHKEALVADGQVSVNPWRPLAREPKEDGERRFSFLLAFADSLQPAAKNSPLLWDPHAPERFWSDYTVLRTNPPSVPALEKRELVLGPISLRQLSLSPGTLRVFVERADRLQVHFPFTARVFYGRAHGLLQARLAWLPDQLALDSRVKLILEGMQAGAVGLASPSGHIPFLEDEIEGEITVDTDGVQLNREALRTLLADARQAEQLDHVKIEVRLRHAPRARSSSGVVQLSSDTQINLMNKLLHKIIRRVQLRASPQVMSYRNLAFCFQAMNGKVQTKCPLLELEGLKVFSGHALDVESDISLHWGRKKRGLSGEQHSFRSLVYFLLQNLRPDTGR